MRGNPFSFKGSTDSFTLRAQNDKPFSCHECRKVYAVSCRSFPLKKSRLPFFGSLQSVDKIQVLFLRRLRRICVFSLTRAAKKHLVSEKPPIQRFFKGAGVVLAGIECSPKIFDFRANGIPVQERVDFFDTLKAAVFRQP